MPEKCAITHKREVLLIRVEFSKAAQNPVARLLMIRALRSTLQNPSNIQDVH